MLKGINSKVSADLLGILASMGHGDELVICDRNFPGISNATRVVNYRATDVATVLSLVLELYPVDTFVEEPLVRMQVVGDPHQVTEGQKKIHALAQKLEGREFSMGSIPREAFYERARKAYATVITSDYQPYQCFVLVKGVL